MFGADGTLIGRFHTLWRKEADGAWRLLLERHPRPDPEACR